MNWIDDRHASPTSRAAARAAWTRRTAGSRCSAPPTTRSSPSTITARTRAARLSQGIVHGDVGHLPAAQLGDLARNRQGARRRRGRGPHDPGQGRRRAAFHRARRRGRPGGVRHARRAGAARREDHLPLLRGRLRRAGEVAAGRRRSSVRGDPDHPANFGRLCSKGSALAETLGLEGRLLHPEIDGRAGRLGRGARSRRRAFSETIAEHGPDSVAFYVSGQLLTEDYYVANKLMKGFIGSANIDTNSRLCMASSVAGHRRAFGSDTVPGTYEDLELADLVVLVGSNLAWCHPVLYQRLAAAKEARAEMKVVLIDPRRTMTADIADLHLPIRRRWRRGAVHRPAAHTSPSTSRIDRAYVEAHTTGFEAGAGAPRRGSSAASKSPIRPASPSTTLDGVLRLFAGTEKVVTVYSQGVNQSAHGTDKVNAIINCHLATGRIGKPGMGPFSVTGQPNAMGGREVGGLANMLAAHMEIENADASRPRAALLAVADDRRRAGPQGGRHVPRRRRRPHQGAVDHGDQSGRLHAGGRQRRGGAPRLPVRRRLRCRARHRHGRATPMCSAGRRLGREGRHRHQFGAAHLAPAAVPAGARRGAARLVDHLRSGEAHGLCATPSPTLGRPRSSPSMPRSRPSRMTARATSTSARSPASTGGATTGMQPFQWPRPRPGASGRNALLRRRRLLHARRQGALRAGSPASPRRAPATRSPSSSTPAACATIGTP